MLSPKLCWLAFGATSAAILFSMLLMGLKDRTALEFVLVDGGIVESSPALIFLLASVSSGLIVLKTKKLLPWAFFAVFCFFSLARRQSGAVTGYWGGNRRDPPRRNRNPPTFTIGSPRWSQNSCPTITARMRHRWSPRS